VEREDPERHRLRRAPVNRYLNPVLADGETGTPGRCDVSRVPLPGVQDGVIAFDYLAGLVALRVHGGPGYPDRDGLAVQRPEDEVDPRGILGEVDSRRDRFGAV